MSFYAFYVGGMVSFALCMWADLEKVDWKLPPPLDDYDLLVLVFD